MHASGTRKDKKMYKETQLKKRNWREGERALMHPLADYMCKKWDGELGYKRNATRSAI